MKQQDIAAALALARDCKHPDAVWLTSIFEGKDVSTKEKVRKVFLSHRNDARALCFTWCLSDGHEDDFSLLRRAFETGNAFACSTLCLDAWDQGEEDKAFRLAHFAATQHERDGFYQLGLSFEGGFGCEKVKKQFFFCIFFFYYYYYYHYYFTPSPPLPRHSIFFSFFPSSEKIVFLTSRTMHASSSTKQTFSCPRLR